MPTSRAVGGVIFIVSAVQRLAMADETPNEARGAQAPNQSPSAGEDDDGRTNPFGVVPLFVLVLLVVGGLLLIFKLRDVGNIQDCVSSGRRNCVPVDVPPEK